MNLIKKYYDRTRSTIAILFVLVSIFAFPIPALAAGINWGYGGRSNPTEWGKISPDFAKCELGRDQSPIDINGAIAGQPTRILFNYQSSPLVVVNTGHTIQVNYAPGSTISIDGEEYSLLQFHFHTPSEHQITGKAAAMELHLVHRNAAGKLAVVGVMINEGKENPLISQIWQAIPAIGQTKTVSKTIDAANILPENKSYYSYIGSLTTPPCSEEVRWNIIVEPISISDRQIREFERLYQVNARPIQATNNRKIELHRN